MLLPRFLPVSFSSCFIYEQHCSVSHSFALSSKKQWWLLIEYSHGSQSFHFQIQNEKECLFVINTKITLELENQFDQISSEIKRLNDVYHALRKWENHCVRQTAIGKGTYRDATHFNMPIFYILLNKNHQTYLSNKNTNILKLCEYDGRAALSTL